MNTSTLSKLIKKAVKEAIKEELREILVEISVRENEQLVENLGNDDYNELPSYENIISKPSSISEALELTKSSMSREDVSNLLGSSNSPVTSTPAGIDVSKLDFAQKAASIYKKSLEKNGNA